MTDRTLDFTRHKSEKLAESGYQHLRDGDAEAALKVAAELEVLRYTASFEIAARAHGLLGDREAAVSVLRRGLDLAPAVWINWQLLGNYLSDLERYDEAGPAHQRALACPDVHESSIHLNQAIMAARRGRHDDALSYSEQITDPDLAVRAASIRVPALAAMGRCEEALRAGEAILEAAGAGEPEELAHLAGRIGYVRLESGGPPHEIAARALDDLERFDRGNAGLLALIRDADNQYSAAATYYRMTVQAELPAGDPLSRFGHGYFVAYDVVADSIEEALAFVRRMEAPSVRGALQVTTHAALEDRPDEPKGVYGRGPCHYYENED